MGGGGGGGGGGGAHVQRQLDGVVRANVNLSADTGTGAVATAHKEYGYDCTWEQCRPKMNTLVQRYRYN